VVAVLAGRLPVSLQVGDTVVSLQIFRDPDLPPSVLYMRLAGTFDIGDIRTCLAGGQSPAGAARIEEVGLSTPKAQ
jgi:hypothetical protein